MEPRLFNARSNGAAAAAPLPTKTNVVATRSAAPIIPSSTFIRPTITSVLSKASSTPPLLPSTSAPSLSVTALSRTGISSEPFKPTGSVTAGSPQTASGTIRPSGSSSTTALVPGQSLTPVNSTVHSNSACPRKSWLISEFHERTVLFTMGLFQLFRHPLTSLWPGRSPINI